MVSDRDVALALLAGGGVVVIGGLLLRPAAALPTTNFRWSIGSVNGNINWAPQYLEECYTALKAQLGLDLAEPASWNGIPNPLPVSVTVDDSSTCPGVIRGWAGGIPPALGFCSSNWNEGPYTHWILAHETSNLLTAVCVSYDWPLTWWANSSSPFPILSSLEAMRTMGLTGEAAFMESILSTETCYSMFRNLLTDFGWPLFQNLFQLLRTDRVNLAAVDSSYTVADYLQRAAGQNLATYFTLCPNITVYPPYP